MIDLTPLDVRKKRGDFRQKLRGYDPEEVDTFLELVEGRMEDLVKENRSLSEKVNLLQTRVDAMEGREQAVQDALVSAQALRKEVQDQAKKDARTLEDQARREIDLLRREVEGRIEGRVREADALLKERQKALEDLERNRRRFLKAFRSLLEREIDAVEVEEARRPLDDAPLDLQLQGWRSKKVDDAAPDEASGAEGESHRAAQQGVEPGSEPSPAEEPTTPENTDPEPSLPGDRGESRASIREEEPWGPSATEESGGPSGDEQPGLALEDGKSPPPEAPEPDRPSARELLLGEDGEGGEAEESGRTLPEPFWLSELLTRKQKEREDQTSSDTPGAPAEDVRDASNPRREGHDEEDSQPEGFSGGEVI